MKNILLLILLLSISCFSFSIAEENGRMPLDLPSGGSGGDEDEDSPEIINFWGGEYEGDAFFWCLDKSCSMGWNGEINQLKQEFTQAVNSLSTQAEFGVVAFSGSTLAWSMIPQRANAGNRGSAIAWVQSLNPGGWTCLGPAGVRAINIANQSQKAMRQILILSDGEPYCDGQNTASICLTSITQANWQHIPINTIYIATDNGGISFMQTLANMNNGTFSNP